MPAFTTHSQVPQFAVRTPQEHVRQMKAAHLLRQAYSSGLLLGLLIPFLLPVLPLSSAQAGAWAQSKGTLYSKATVGVTNARRQLLRGGTTSPSVYSSRALFLYGEYGLIDKLTVIALLPAYQAIKNPVTDFSTRRTVTLAANSAVLGDIHTQVRYQFFDSPALALQLGVKWPLGYKASDQPALGTGYVDADLKLQAGLSLYPIPAWVGLEAGYRARFGPYENELPLAFDAGYKLFDVVFIQAIVDATISLGDTAASSTNGAVSTAETRLRIGGGLIYPLPFEPVESLSLSLNVLRTIAGANTLSSTEYFFGLSYKGTPFARDTQEKGNES